MVPWRKFCLYILAQLDFTNCLCIGSWISLLCGLATCIHNNDNVTPSLKGHPRHIQSSQYINSLPQKLYVYVYNYEHYFSYYLDRQAPPTISVQIIRKIDLTPTKLRVGAKNLGLFDAMLKFIFF